MCKKTLIIMILLIVFIAVSSCKTPIQISSDYAYAKFRTECLGLNQDGTQTLRVFGRGKNKACAIDQAIKNAMCDVLFNGINNCIDGCVHHPIVYEVNAREKYSAYFNQFFSNKGKYLKFIKIDERRMSRIKSSSNIQENWGLIVTVDRAALQQQMITDNILQQ